MSAKYVPIISCDVYKTWTWRARGMYFLRCDTCARKQRCVPKGLSIGEVLRAVGDWPPPFQDLIKPPISGEEAWYSFRQSARSFSPERNLQFEYRAHYCYWFPTYGWCLSDFAEWCPVLLNEFYQVKHAERLCNVAFSSLQALYR